MYQNEKKEYQRGDSEILSVIGRLFIIFIIWGGISLFQNVIGGEKEGVVKYDDCRQVITLKSDTWQKYYKSFTCTYDKTKSGRIMGGICVHTDNDSIFTSSCATAYVYEKKQADGICTDSNYPYLGSDDKCYAGVQTGITSSGLKYTVMPNNDPLGLFPTLTPTNGQSSSNAVDEAYVKSLNLEPSPTTSTYKGIKLPN